MEGSKSESTEKCRVLRIAAYGIKTQLASRTTEVEDNVSLAIVDLAKAADCTGFTEDKAIIMLKWIHTNR